MSFEIVNDALKYYDTNNEKYKHIKNHMKYFKIAVNDKNDIESLKLIFYDDDKKELFTSRCEILGKYIADIDVWIWGWSLPNIAKYLTTIIRKVFLYGTDINIDRTNIANTILKNELVTSRFKIEDEIQIDIHCAIASYLSKKPFVFAFGNLPSVSHEGQLHKINTSSDNNKIIYYMFIIDPPDI